MDTRVWVCPALCGCELSITGKWAHDLMPDGKQYGHPVPGTIKNIEIVNVCAEHQHYLTDPLPENPYFINGEHYSGYIPLTTQPRKITKGTPVDKLLDPKHATPAQKLYLMLYEHVGGPHSPDTCECVIYLHSNRRTSEIVAKAHPHHTELCEIHPDDFSHGKAMSENRLKNEALGHILDHIPAEHIQTMTDDGGALGKKFKFNPRWEFDADRNVHITLHASVNDNTKSDLQHKVSIKFGNKVIVN